MKNNKIFYSMHAINGAAKNFSNKKQGHYNNRNHEMVLECKSKQSELYLLKSLSLLTMEKEGDIKRLGQSIDSNDCILENFESTDEKHKLHAISSNQDNPSGLPLYENPENCSKSNLYLPCKKYLEKHLDFNFYVLYSFLQENSFTIKSKRKIETLVDTLKKLKIQARIEKIRDFYMDWMEVYEFTYTISLHLDNCKICYLDVKVISKEDDDFLYPYIIDGSLEFKEIFNDSIDGWEENI